MTGLITLPLRIGMQAARLATRPAVLLLRELTGSGPHDDGAGMEAAPPRSGRPPVRPRRPVDRNSKPAAPAEPAAPAAAAEPAARVEPAAPAAAPPVRDEHVSEEPELVAESADVEATEPPGAEISVDEPWPGYRRAKAADIIARLPDLSPEELGVAQLYEGTHRRRRTVLEAIERQLKVGNAR